MRVEGEKRFEAPRETVWRVLNSPESMATPHSGPKDEPSNQIRYFRCTEV